MVLFCSSTYADISLRCALYGFGRQKSATYLNSAAGCAAHARACVLALQHGTRRGCGLTWGGCARVAACETMIVRPQPNAPEEAVGKVAPVERLCVSFGVLKKRVDGLDCRLESIGAQLRT